MCTSVDLFARCYLATSFMAPTSSIAEDNSKLSSRTSRTSSFSTNGNHNQNNFGHQLLRILKNMFSIKSSTHNEDNFHEKSLLKISNNVLPLALPTIEPPLEPAPPITIVEAQPENETEKKIKPNEDDLYNYEALLKRCMDKLDLDRPEMLIRQHTPVPIPHAHLIFGGRRTVLINWPSYQRLCKSLQRDIALFQQFVNESFDCQTSINKQHYLVLNVKTNVPHFDKILNKFLTEYVTCQQCRSANTHLMRLNGALMLLECQYCGCQRPVKKLKWKKQ